MYRSLKYSKSLHSCTHSPCRSIRVCRVLSGNVPFCERVPKRNKKERAALLRNISKQRAVLFPERGEMLTLKYSHGLQLIWGKKLSKTASSQVMVKHVIPRSTKSSTAVVFAVKVS